MKRQREIIIQLFALFKRMFIIIEIKNIIWDCKEKNEREKADEKIIKS